MIRYTDEEMNVFSDEEIYDHDIYCNHVYDRDSYDNSAKYHDNERVTLVISFLRESFW